MSKEDEPGAVDLMVERLGQEFSERSQIEIATAVLDAADHALIGDGHRYDGLVERSARVRLSSPVLSP